ncbi:MAG TPA: energy transducer TonB [Thermoanaerobaculaceae bacterium]|nr:energy transducer TonB [Thermoanaerobaculaceae bacterium]HPS76867.1 energy transducer TonB [Thermoanaerobaculaceae bacterium]
MFETTLVASRRQKGLRQRLLALPAAIALHGLAVTFFLVGQLWATSPLQEPTLPTVYVALLPPPEPISGGGKGQTHTVVRRIPRESVTQPLAVPDEQAQALKQSSELAGGKEVYGSLTLGPEGGDGTVPGGFEKPVTSPPTPQREDPPILCGGLVEPPVLTRRIDPRYPETARKAKVQGVVILEAIIDREGSVVDGRILRDIGFGCGDAALDAIRGWRYQPARLNSRTVSVYLTITVNFQLS